VKTWPVELRPGKKCTGYFPALIQLSRGIVFQNAWNLSFKGGWAERYYFSYCILLCLPFCVWG